MKKYSLLSLLFLATVIVWSCKKDNDNGGGNGGGTTVTKIKVTVTPSQINLSYPENAALKAVDANGTEITSQCSFQVNGVNNFGATYTPTVVGTFKFTATKDTTKSDTATLIVTNAAKAGDTLYVSTDVDTLELNGYDIANIKVTDMTGADVTSKCNLAVNGVFSSNTYTPFATGTYTITATKGLIPCKAKKVTVIDQQPSPFTKKLLVEDCTGAWCGYCTRVASSLETYKTSHPNTIVVALHGGQGADPYKYQYYTNYNTTWGVSGYPTAIVNRNFKWNENTSALNAELAKYAPLGLALESTISGSTITGKAKVKFNITTSSKLKIVVALVENKLIYPQTNYYSPSGGSTPYLYGGQNPVTNFEHNGVMRKAATDLFGDVIPAAQQKRNNVYEFSFTMTASGTTGNSTSFSAIPANCSLVAYVVDDNGVLNVQSATAGTVKNFD